MFRTGLLELCVSLTLKSDTMGVAWREEKNHDSHCEVKFQQQFVKLLSRFYLTECLGSLGDSDMKISHWRRQIILFGSAENQPVDFYFIIRHF